MTSFNKRVYEMIARVLVFWTKYRDLIAKDSLPGQLFSLLEAAFQKFSKHATRQAAGMDTVRRSTRGRDKARRFSRATGHDLPNRVWTGIRALLDAPRRTIWLLCEPAGTSLDSLNR